MKFKQDYESELPQVVGAIDGMHILIQTPSVEGKALYFSRTQNYAIELLFCSLMWNKILEDFQAAVMIQEIREIRHFFKEPKIMKF